MGRVITPERRMIRYVPMRIVPFPGSPRDLNNKRSSKGGEMAIVKEKRLLIAEVHGRDCPYRKRQRCGHRLIHHSKAWIETDYECFDENCPLPKVLPEGKE